MLWYLVVLVAAVMFALSLWMVSTILEYKQRYGLLFGFACAAALIAIVIINDPTAVALLNSVLS